MLLHFYLPLLPLTDQVEALSAEGEPSEEQQQVLNGLQDRVNQAIELYGEEGAMVRIGGRSVHIHSQTCDNSILCQNVHLYFQVSAVPEHCS